MPFHAVTEPTARPRSVRKVGTTAYCRELGIASTPPRTNQTPTRARLTAPGPSRHRQPSQPTTMPSRPPPSTVTHSQPVP
ncbi:Uncharacterised protein [Mycobacteroides abscessus subsp. abscessus]|nr:Uncharacterised protein [Mycobacteroides abscessus subsp. abscessus]